MFLHWYPAGLRAHLVGYLFGVVLGPRIFGAPAPSPEQKEALMNKVKEGTDARPPTRLIHTEPMLCGIAHSVATLITQRGSPHSLYTAHLLTLPPAVKRVNDHWLSKPGYIAGGDKPTLADLQLISEIEQIRFIRAFDWSPYPNVQRYRELMARVPHYNEVFGQLLAMTGGARL